MPPRGGQFSPTNCRGQGWNPEEPGIPDPPLSLTAAEPAPALAAQIGRKHAFSSSSADLLETVFTASLTLIPPFLPSIAIFHGAPLTSEQPRHTPLDQRFGVSFHMCVCLEPS